MVTRRILGLPIKFSTKHSVFPESQIANYIVTSTLDFGNAALFGITGTLLHRLEMVQRAAARVVLCIDRRDHRSMTAALRDLHWLPIFRLCLMI